jgi:3-deoxy-manno-octulosonate cytidylyltransferase (CMP-KDO synthetase)
MTEPCKIVIPARFGSSRLPGKPLLPIGGKPMIVHVCERALEAKCGEVLVATDDQRIADAVAGIGVTAVMTRPEHASGSERIAEVVDVMGWDVGQVVVNLQGDEPMMDPGLIRDLAGALASQDLAEVATVATPIGNRDDVFDPNVVKVVTDARSYALYFSRAPIPWSRDAFATDGCNPDLPQGAAWLRHIGIYAYSAGYLREYVKTPPTALEEIERLEQLRILWMGKKILVLSTDFPPPAGVDTAADLERVRAQAG